MVRRSARLDYGLQRATDRANLLRRTIGIRTTHQLQPTAAIQRIRQRQFTAAHASMPSILSGLGHTDHHLLLSAARHRVHHIFISGQLTLYGQRLCRCCARIRTGTALADIVNRMRASQRPAGIYDRIYKDAVLVMILRKRRIIVAAAIIVAAIVLTIYYVVDPTSAHMPQCTFKLITGLNCPGCGSQRALHALLHGQIARAIAFNPGALMLIPLGILYAFVEWTDKHPCLRHALLSKPAVYTILSMLVFWTVVRNIVGI